MPSPDAQHFIEYFYSEIRTDSQQALIYEKKGGFYQQISKREAVAMISAFSRALHATGMNVGDRVILQLPASASFWISEWAALANRTVAVIVPQSFSLRELGDIAIECSAKVIVIDTLAAAIALSDRASEMPNLTHIICLEGNAQAAVAIISWEDFLASGRSLPDRTSALMRSIAAKDTAIQFYYKDAKDLHQVQRYTHTMLLESAVKINDMLSAESPPRPGDTMATAQDWDSAIPHIVSCYVPLLRHCSMQIADSSGDVKIFGNHPGVIIGTASYFGNIRLYILDQMKQSGKLESEMLTTALAFGKIKYEAASKKKLSGLQKCLDVALKFTIIKKIKGLLGNNLHTMIGIDGEAPYDLELFFHTFGIDLIELDPDILR